MLGPSSPDAPALRRRMDSGWCLPHLCTHRRGASPTAVVYLHVQDRPQRHHFEAMVIRFDLIVLSSLRTTT